MIKQESSRSSIGGKAIKILNDERIAPMPTPLVMTSVPLAPTKQISISIAKAKQPPTKRKADHYVLKTFKGEGNADGTESEDIDFVFTDNDEVREANGGMSGPSGEIREELHLSANEGDEGEDGDSVLRTEEIVEHVCGKCYKSFRRFNGLKKHLDFCRFDSGYHLRKAEMIKNLEKIEKDAIIMENKDVCFCCGESYDTFHLGHINCPDCPKSFKSQMSYERHIFITHSEFNDHPCSVCNAKLRSANLLTLHEEQHRNRGKPYACKICGKDFTRSYHLKRHQKYSSCSANEHESMSCKVCNKVFYRLDNLRAHLKQHLGTQVTKKLEYMCPICKNCFYSLSTLNIHTRTHTGERPFDCDLCEKKFPSLVALKKHRRYHTGEKPYTCSVCNQSFAVKEVLNRHMKRHTGERPHVCTECGKSFIQATQLRSHAKTHLKPHECTSCPEKFKTEKQLLRHAKSHNKLRRGAKQQAAADGAKTTSTAATVKKRKRKERTDCAICEKNFDTAKSLHFHILKVHEVDPEEFVNAKPLEDSDIDIENGGKRKKVQKVEKRRAPTTRASRLLTAGGAQIPPASSTDNGVVVQEFIVDELGDGATQQTVILDNETYTVIPLDSVEPAVATAEPAVKASPDRKSPRTPRKSLAESLAAAIADDDDETAVEAGCAVKNEEDLELTDNVGKLLDMLVDTATLKKFGWPKTPVENVLCKVIENCGHDLSKDADTYKVWDYATRMREYVKLLFTVVIHNDSIKELLNNYPIDEVIEYVLGNDDDDDDDEEEEEEDDKSIARIAGGDVHNTEEFIAEKM